jgi:hypothetical protein
MPPRGDRLRWPPRRARRRPDTRPTLATDEQSWSDELYAILGVAPETTLPSQTSFTSTVHPDDIARVAQRHGLPQ